MAKCIHCDATHGLIVAGAHNLCRAKASKGLPIAKVTTCDTCDGSGFDSAKQDAKFRAISGMLNPPGSVFDAISKTCLCARCGGKGVL